MIKITYEEAVELLDRAVEEKGEDYVYPDAGPYSSAGCLYFADDGQPSCIVGHVLAYKKVSREVIARNHLNNSSVASVKDQGIFTCDIPTEILLSAAQDRQDGGAPWGEAVAFAKDCAGQCAERPQ